VRQERPYAAVDWLRISRYFRRMVVFGHDMEQCAACAALAATTAVHEEQTSIHSHIP
jgi:hypothetical protein